MVLYLSGQKKKGAIKTKAQNKDYVGGANVDPPIDNITPVNVP